MVHNTNYFKQETKNYIVNKSFYKKLKELNGLTK